MVSVIAQLVSGIGLDVELVQDGGQRQDGFVQRELPADAGARAGSERFVDPRSQRSLVVGQESVGVEVVGIWAPRGVAVGRVEQDEHPVAAVEVVAAAADAGRRFRLPVVAGHDRGQPQGLVDDSTQVAQFGDVVEFDVGVAAIGPVLIDFGAGRSAASGCVARWCSANATVLAVVSLPATRSVRTWLMMLSSSSRSPVSGSAVCSILSRMLV